MRRFVGGVAAGEEFAGEQDDLAGLESLDLGAGDGVEVDAACGVDVHGEPGPGLERGWGEFGGAAAVEHKVGVAGGGAVGDHGDGQVGGVGGEVEDLDVEHGGEAAESLGADAEGVDLIVELDAELFDVGFGAS